MAATLADGTFKYKFFNENVLISITNSLKFVLKGPINNINSSIGSGANPLSEPTMVSLLTHIARP